MDDVVCLIKKKTPFQRPNINCVMAQVFLGASWRRDPYSLFLSGKILGRIDCVTFWAHVVVVSGGTFDDVKGDTLYS